VDRCVTFGLFRVFFFRVPLRFGSRHSRDFVPLFSPVSSSFPAVFFRCVLCPSHGGNSRWILVRFSDLSHMLMFFLQSARVGRPECPFSDPHTTSTFSPRLMLNFRLSSARFSPFFPSLTAFTRVLSLRLTCRPCVFPLVAPHVTN